jgi:hypothetical protein
MGQPHLAGSRQGPVVGFCEHSDEPLNSIRKDIFWQYEWQSAFQIMSCTMEWVSEQVYILLQ